MLVHVNPLRQPPGGHAPVTGSQGWFTQWQVSVHLSPNVPAVHATKNSCNDVYIQITMLLHAKYNYISVSGS